MRALALLLACLAAPAPAQEAPGSPLGTPEARRAHALAVLAPIPDSTHPGPQCAGFFWAVTLLNAELPRLARHGYAEPWPAGQPQPFAWVEAEAVREWRSFTPLPPDAPSFIRLYLDAFGGLRWTVANQPIYQRDKAACLALVDGPADGAAP